MECYALSTENKLSKALIGTVYATEQHFILYIHQLYCNNFNVMRLEIYRPPSRKPKKSANISSHKWTCAIHWNRKIIDSTFGNDACTWDARKCEFCSMLHANCWFIQQHLTSIYNGNGPKNCVVLLRIPTEQSLLNLVSNLNLWSSQLIQLKDIRN